MLVLVIPRPCRCALPADEGFAGWFHPSGCERGMSAGGGCGLRNAPPLQRSRLFEELVLEEQQIDDRNRDIGIGQIEDRAEEVVAAVNQK